MRDDLIFRGLLSHLEEGITVLTIPRDLSLPFKFRFILAASLGSFIDA